MRSFTSRRRILFGISSGIRQLGNLRVERKMPLEMRGMKEIWWNKTFRFERSLFRLAEIQCAAPFVPVRTPSTPVSTSGRSPARRNISRKPLPSTSVEAVNMALGSCAPPCSSASKNGIWGNSRFLADFPLKMI